MGEFWTYSLIDFIPFIETVYHRLFVRLNQYVWPGQIVAGVAAFGLLWGGWKKSSGVVGWVLSAAWVSVGWFFHIQYYGELNWVGTYVGWVFFAQAALVGVTGEFGGFAREDDGLGAHGWLGLAISAAGIFVYPLVSPLVERSWAGVEVFGLMPNPTVIATLGCALLSDRIPWHLLPIPLLWCLVTGATAFAIGTTAGLVAATFGPATVVAAIWRSLTD